MIGDVFRARFVFSRSEPAAPDVSPSADLQLVDVFDALGGVTVEGGLYRVYSPQRALAATAMVEDAMPELRGRIDCFAADWLGCHFALDKARVDGGENLVLILEPGTGEVLEVPVSVRSFHDSELVEFAEAALAVSFYGRGGRRAATGTRSTNRRAFTPRRCFSGERTTSRTSRARTWRCTGTSSANFVPQHCPWQLEQTSHRFALTSSAGSDGAPVRAFRSGRMCRCASS